MPYTIKIRFNIIVPSMTRSLKRSLLSSDLQNEIVTAVLISPCVLHEPSILLSSSGRTNVGGSKPALHCWCVSSSVLCHSPNILSYLFLEKSLKIRDQVSHPYTTTGSTVLFISVCDLVSCLNGRLYTTTYYTVRCFIICTLEHLLVAWSNRKV
jgi:hypothetical protein